ncbi:universal stress protein [Aquisalimonas sp.]|uniref:universal stress protein n=1 Tax=Aquisalimonas sp. TaxID=1872621 RepID=UPI0025BAD9DB|nr:universal stress protein [Aquisalimonas sp.]
MTTPEVIVPVDWTRRSLAAMIPASVLAKQTGRSLHLVSIVPTESEIEARRRGVREEAEQRGIREPQISILKADLNTVPIGEREGTLMRVINQSPDALVCMATHARSAIGDVLLGSVASDILEGSAHPVALIGPRFSADWQGPLRTVIACLDGSELSERILAPAAAMASATGSGLMLVQVQQPEASHQAMIQDAAESGYLQSKAAEVQRDHHLKANWDVLHGRDPGRTIAEYVAGYPGAIVAMTTHGHTGVRKLAFGSVARDVIHSINCPVLALRPRADG